MAQHVAGIAIGIKAFLPTGKTLDEQLAALSLVKAAHESGDYSELLKVATIDEVKSEQKTRRIETVPPAAATPPTAEAGEVEPVEPEQPSALTNEEIGERAAKVRSKPTSAD